MTMGQQDKKGLGAALWEMFKLLLRLLLWLLTLIIRLCNYLLSAIDTLLQTILTK